MRLHYSTIIVVLQYSGQVGNHAVRQVQGSPFEFSVQVTRFAFLSFRFSKSAECQVEVEKKHAVLSAYSSFQRSPSF